MGVEVAVIVEVMSSASSTQCHVLRSSLPFQAFPFVMGSKIASISSLLYNSRHSGSRNSTPTGPLLAPAPLRFARPAPLPRIQRCQRRGCGDKRRGEELSRNGCRGQKIGCLARRRGGFVQIRDAVIWGEEVVGEEIEGREMRCWNVGLVVVVEGGC